MMKLALGPILYFWSRDEVEAFYREAAEWPVDTVYLGEAVCSKRRAMRLEDWVRIGEMLSAAGKGVVLTSLALIEAESELLGLQRIVDNGRFTVEANDWAAVQLLAGHGPFVAGPHLNCYNGETLALLAEQGADRWVMPVELSGETLRDLQAQRPDGMQTEVFAFGRLPLAFSARCFTARAEGLPKDDCQLRCADYPDGILLQAQDEREFLAVNGIQTQSAAVSDLLGAVPEMDDLGVDLLRLSPRSRHMAAVVDHFHRVVDGRADAAQAAAELDARLNTPVCNGYWYGDAGMAYRAGAS